MKINGTNLISYGPAYLRARVTHRALTSEAAAKESERTQAQDALRRIEAECKAVQEKLAAPTEIIEAFQQLFTSLPLEQIDQLVSNIVGSSLSAGAQMQLPLPTKKQLDLKNITFNIRFGDGTQQALIEVCTEITEEKFPDGYVTAAELAQYIIDHHWVTDSNNKAPTRTALMSNIQSSLARSEGLFTSASLEGKVTRNRCKLFYLDPAKASQLKRYGKVPQCDPKRRPSRTTEVEETYAEGEVLPEAGVEPPADATAEALDLGDPDPEVADFCKGAHIRQMNGNGLSVTPHEVEG